MNSSEFSELQKLVDEKTEIMLQYDAITSKILKVDFEKVDELFDSRQTLIEKFNKLSEECGIIISKQTPSRQATLKKLFSMQFDGEFSANMMALRDKLIKLSSIGKAVAEKETKIFQKLEKIKKALADDSEKLKSNKKVIDYIDTMSNDELTKGRTLNEKS
ncbi:MAG: hypothetical protein RR540_03650 [Oscillospiraceae bacterium]